MFNTFNKFNPLASDELTETRRAICQSCPQRSETSVAVICLACGCMIKAKTALKDASCPLYKWPGDKQYDNSNS